MKTAISFTFGICLGGALGLALVNATRPTLPPLTVEVEVSQPVIAPLPMPSLRDTLMPVASELGRIADSQREQAITEQMRLGWEVLNSQ